MTQKLVLSLHLRTQRQYQESSIFLWYLLGISNRSNHFLFSSSTGSTQKYQKHVEITYTYVKLPQKSRKYEENEISTYVGQVLEFSNFSLVAYDQYYWGKILIFFSQYQKYVKVPKIRRNHVVTRSDHVVVHRTHVEACTLIQGKYKCTINVLGKCISTSGTQVARRNTTMNTLKYQKHVESLSSTQKSRRSLYISRRNLQTYSVQVLTGSHSTQIKWKYLKHVGSTLRTNSSTTKYV